MNKNFRWSVCVLFVLFLNGCGTGRQAVTVDEIQETVQDTQLAESTGETLNEYKAYMGTCQLDGQKTEESLNTHSSLQEIFGTGLSYGAAMEISEDHKFSYYIGVGIGGEGQWEWENGSFTAVVAPYVEEEDTHIFLTPVTEGEKSFLTMEFAGEILYWSLQ